MRTNLYRQMVTIRRFEERVLELFTKGDLCGTAHTCIGQEVIPAAIMPHLEKKDIVVSNHRSHGHYIARTGDMSGLLAEMMGKPWGVCGGRGGSQHLHNPEWNFYSNGVQGNMVPVSAGMAYAEKVKGSGAIVVCFIGDGTWGCGSLYETMNMMALWELPVLLVVEDNGIAQTTDTGDMDYPSIIEHVSKAFFGICQYERHIDVHLWPTYPIQKIVQQVRKNEPTVFHIPTQRLGPHSKGDDSRTAAELNALVDPLALLAEQIPEAERAGIDAEVAAEIELAERLAREGMVG